MPWQEESKEDNKVQRQGWWYEWYRQPDKRMRRLVYRAKARAKENALPYDEELATMLEENPPHDCWCCGKLLDYDAGARNWQTPSLDRQDNSKGYTIDNVGVICWRCNLLKRDGTLEEFEAIVEYMRRDLPFR